MFVLLSTGSEVCAINKILFLIQIFDEKKGLSHLVLFFLCHTTSEICLN
jgi:hypothetical protein